MIVTLIYEEVGYSIYQQEATIGKLSRFCYIYSPAGHLLTNKIGEEQPLGSLNDMGMGVAEEEKD